MSVIKRRKLTDKEKEEIEVEIKKKVKSFRPEKSAACDHHEGGGCEIACIADPIGTASCPPCPS